MSSWFGVNMDTSAAGPVREAYMTVGRRVIAATTIGNALEFFDFTVFSFLSIYIAKLFFPTFSEAGQLLLTVATFGMGFVMRPVGGFLIGMYADRYGRKRALLLTIALMAAGCLLIAVAPTYAQIGVAAPCLIVVARLIQGLSAGGEVGASAVLLVEASKPAERGFYSSWQFGSQSLGVMIGALVTSVLGMALTTDEILAWGWRLPFFLGTLIAPVGWYIRRAVDETISPLTLSRPRTSFSRVLREHGWAAANGVLLIVGGITTSYIVTLFLPTFAIRQLGLPPAIAMNAAIVAGAVGFFAAPLVGLASDRFGRKPLIWGARCALLLLVLPSFQWLIQSRSSNAMYTISAVLGVFLAIQMTATITMISEMFPQSIRATAMATVYGIGVSLFGGFSQFIATLLIAVTGSNLAPAWYLIFCIVVSSFALPWCRDRTGEPLNAE
jgi:MHS family proline/betaine transporter-like MFS transporter